MITKVEQDFERMRAWCNDEWRWVGVVVTISDSEGDDVRDSRRYTTRRQVMWSDMKRQFIDAAARVMWAGAWADHVSEVVTHGELPEIAPPTPDYARLEAAILLGKLEQANGCELAVIVQAAAKADCGVTDQSKLCIEHDDDGCPIDVAAFASDVALEALGAGVSWTDDHEAFTLPGGKPRTFKSADGSIRCTKCQCFPDLCSCSSGKPFIVPSIEFTYEEGEE